MFVGNAKNTRTLAARKFNGHFGLSIFQGLGLFAAMILDHTEFEIACPPSRRPFFGAPTMVVDRNFGSHGDVGQRFRL